jgi:hypothetical protein
MLWNIIFAHIIVRMCVYILELTEVILINNVNV